MFAAVILVMAVTCTDSLALTVDEGKQKASTLRDEIETLEVEYNAQVERYNYILKFNEQNERFGILMNEAARKNMQNMLRLVFVDAELEKNIKSLKAELAQYEKFESMDYSGDYKLTGYCPCYKCSEGWGTKTASGAKATEGITVAADKRKLPLGTKIYIEGVGERIVQDIGGGVKGNRIDIFVNNHSSCYKDAYNRTTKVYIINE